jgi:hypothetical protein
MKAYNGKPFEILHFKNGRKEDPITLDVTFTGHSEALDYCIKLGIEDSCIIWDCNSDWR